MDCKLDSKNTGENVNFSSLLGLVFLFSWSRRKQTLCCFILNQGLASGHGWVGGITTLDNTHARGLWTFNYKNIKVLCNYVSTINMNKNAVHHSRTKDIEVEHSLETM